MMQNAVLSIAGENGIYVIKASGRATFECAGPLRDLAKKLETEDFSKVDVDLSECQGMDSTFMGILAMLGLRSRKLGAEMNIVNANELNKSLLYGLGLKKLFNYTQGEVLMPENGNASASASSGKLDLESAKTVLDAHKTLMDVDDSNKKKFEAVVDMVQKDIDRLNKDEDR
ncbi:MAG: STAS domain-containing protein [Lentisphaeria bacterium]|nr:STAS domain-containing protein [Lentisphaeria bacterium]